MKKILLPLVFFFASASGVAAATEFVDRVVAVVEKDVITLSELNLAGKEAFARAGGRERSGDLTTALEKTRQQVLQNLIEERLLRQRAVDLNVTVSERELDAAFEQIARQNNLSSEALLDQLQKTAAAETFRKTIRDQILHNKVLGMDVHSRIAVSDAMINATYQARYTRTLKPGEFSLLQIGFVWKDDESGNRAQNPPPVGSRQAAVDQAQRIRQLALAGQDFRELAKKYSELATGADGGALGIVNAEEMAPAMREALSRAPNGGISSVVDAGSTYQFFKILAREGETSAVEPLERVKEEIRERLFQEEARRRYEEWMQELRSRAFIEIL